MVKYYIAGDRGLVGTWYKKKYPDALGGNTQTANYNSRISTKQDLQLHKPTHVIINAATVGGLQEDMDKSFELMIKNLTIQNNIIHNAYKSGVKKLIFLGSSCIYPKFPKIPITEDQLMTSPLEESNSAYAIAKIAGMRMCQAYKEQYGLNAISLMPTNLYGINDNFDLENSHVLPAMIRKFHEAEDKVTLWGDGSAMREFLHVDDLAEACYVCMQKYEDDEHINVGTGEDVTIKELAETVAKIVGNKSIEWDTSKPNGTPRKVLNVDKIKSLGWEPKISLEEGIKSTYEWYCSQL